MVAGPRFVNLVVSDDLRLGFLDLDHLAELGGFGGFALADDLGVRLKQAHQLAGHMRVTFEDAFTRLIDDLPHQGDHLFKISSVPLQSNLLHRAASASTLAAASDFLGETL